MITIILILLVLFVFTLFVDMIKILLIPFRIVIFILTKIFKFLGYMITHRND